jgi:single-strand DNA-binding protein
MAGEPVITIIGARIGKDPEMRLTNSGQAVASFSAAVTPRKKQGDQWVDAETQWFRITSFGREAEAVIENLHKGDKIIVTGRFSMSEFVNKDGVTVKTAEVTADAIAPMLEIPKGPAKPAAKQEDISW